MATQSPLAELPKNPFGNQDGDARFFDEDVPIIPNKTQELLDKYSGIPAGAEQGRHVQRLRDKAYQQFQYPCLGLYRFLYLELSAHPLYDVHVLPLLCGDKDSKEATSLDSPRTFLDLGTCLGQDVRKLIFDGVPVDCVYGADLLAEFVDIGYDLFRDEEKLPRTHFVAPADIFDESSQLKELDAKVDIIHANSVFHLFSWEDQVNAAKRVVKLMRPRMGSLILGSQIARQDSVEVPNRPGLRSDTVYIHDERSWKRLWESVGTDLGLSFTVRTSLSPYPKRKRTVDTPEGISKMTFEVWRD